MLTICSNSNVLSVSKFFVIGIIKHVEISGEFRPFSTAKYFHGRNHFESRDIIRVGSHTNIDSRNCILHGINPTFNHISA